MGNFKLYKEIYLLQTFVALGIVWSSGISVIYTLKANLILPVVLIGSLKLLYSSASIIGTLIKFISFRGALVGLCVTDFLLVIGSLYTASTGDYSYILYFDIVNGGLSIIFGIIFSTKLDGILAVLLGKEVEKVKLFGNRILNTMHLVLYGVLGVLSYYLEEKPGELCEIIVYITVALGILNVVFSFKSYKTATELETCANKLWKQPPEA